MMETTRPQAINLQDAFLKRVRREEILVTIHVINGYQLNDVKVLGYDNFVLIVEQGGKQMLLYKHAISSITPKTACSFSDLLKNDQ